MNLNLKYSNGLISFYMPKELTIIYRLYDLCGRMVLPAITQRAKPGVNQLKLNISSANSGLYLLVLEEKDTGKRYKKLIHSWQ